MVASKVKEPECESGDKFESRKKKTKDELKVVDVEADYTNVNN